MKIIIPNERPMSWNEFYRGGHWSKRSGEKNRVALAVRAQIDPYEARLFCGRVDIFTTVYYQQRPHDSDNITDKFFIDALCGWLIEDDTRQYVRWTATRSEIDRQNPRVEIEIVEVTEER